MTGLLFEAARLKGVNLFIFVPSTITVIAPSPCLICPSYDIVSCVFFVRGFREEE